ncbi:MAG: hypothetical protein K6E74_00075 [Bacilli bacterium]|nr:hypothetical protein [Bacilli bacterium]
MKTQKRIAFVLFVLFVATILFSRVFIILEANHDCKGEDCPICEAIANVYEETKELPLMIIFAPCIISIVYAIVKVLSVDYEIHFFSSPISLKVKLLN